MFSPVSISALYSSLSVNFISDTDATLRTSVSKQMFVLITKLSIGKRSFFITVNSCFRKRNSKHIYLKLLFNHEYSAVPNSNDDV